MLVLKHIQGARGRREFFGVGPASHSSVQLQACVHPTAKGQPLPCPVLAQSALELSDLGLDSDECISVWTATLCLCTMCLPYA